MNRLATIAFTTAVFTSGALCALHGAERDFPPVRELASSAALPDPLLMFDGRRVRTADEWRERRRPELKALFEFYMYGAAPPAPDNVQSSAERVDKTYFGGQATKKEVTVSFGPPGTPDMHLLLVVPNDRPRPAPVFANAVEDQWANPAGQFDMLRAAEPVYRFLGVEGLGVERMPEPGKLVGGRLGYFIRPGKHSMIHQDWEVFWDFADRHFAWVD